MEEKEKRSVTECVAILVLVMVFCAVGGWIYELIFYRIALDAGLTVEHPLAPGSRFTDLADF